ncbi:MAG: FAD-dependent oxidoreductase [Candidatus Paceibacterota bacterium]
MKKLLYRHINLIRYFVIGASAALIDVLSFLFFFNVMSYSATLSTLISVPLATLYAFLMNIYFNFKTTDDLIRRFFSYVSVSGVGLLISALILYVFTDRLGLNGNIIKILTLPLIFILQYTLNKRFSFRDKTITTKKIESNENESEKQTHVLGKKIAVIGGGFSGLSAAYDLARAGHSVSVFERNEVVGGLASGFILDGHQIERAYHFIYQSDKHIIGMAEELGLKDKIAFYPSSISFFCEGTHYPFGTPKDLLLFSPLSFFNRIRAGVTALYLQKTNNWRSLSKITAYDWVRKWAGKQVTEIIWEPLLRGKFDRYYDKVTMSWLWGRIKVRAQSQNKNMNGEKLGYITGGFDAVVQGMVKGIKDNNGTIRLNTGIQKIERTGANIHITTDTGTDETFDVVLATTPSPVFGRMIAEQKEVPEEYLQRLNSIDYLGAIVMVFNTTQEISRHFWYNIKDGRIPFLTMLSTTALTGKEMFGNTYVYYVGAYVPAEHRYFSMSKEEIIAEWDKGIKLMFPHFDQAKIKDRHLFKFKDAQHIVDIGYEEKKLVPFKTPIEGVYLANFSQIYPDDRGTNFAIRDGRAVAREIQSYLDLYEKTDR